MTDERRARILQIADELEAEGLIASNSAVYSRAMGHRGHVVTVMKERRAERAAAGGVLVAEEEDDEEMPETPAAVLAEDVRQLESSYEAWHLALEALWAIEQDGPLSEAQFGRKTWLEYQLAANLRTQETLRTALAQARVRDAVHAAREQHDTRLTEARAQAEAMLQAVATLKDALEDVSETLGAMVDGFFPFRDSRGHQAFDVRSGPEYASELFQQFFANDYRAKDAFQLLMDTPLTMGRLRAALEACPRLHPFSARAIETYLHQQSREEGATNGQHP